MKKIIFSMRSLHITKTLIATTIALIVMTFVPIPRGQWILVSVLVVMCSQRHVGGVMQKAIARFLGTFMAVLATVMVLWLFPGNYWLHLAYLLILIAVFTYIADLGGDISFAGVFGAVTSCIILWSPNSDLMLALARGLDISIGVLIAMLVTRYVFPLHAKKQIRRQMATIYDLIAELFAVERYQHETEYLQEKLGEIEAKIVIEFTALRKLMKEASLESKTFQADLVLYREAAQNQRKLFRLTLLFHGCQREFESVTQGIEQVPLMIDYRESVVEALECLANGSKKSLLQLNDMEIETITEKTATAILHHGHQQNKDDLLISSSAYAYCVRKIGRRLRISLQHLEHFHASHNQNDA